MKTPGVTTNSALKDNFGAVDRGIGYRGIGYKAQYRET